MNSHPAILLIGFFLALLTGKTQAEPYVNAARTLPTTETLTLTDLQVIDAAARHTLNDPRRGFLAILVECEPGEVKSTPFMPSFLTRDDSKSSNTILANFCERNFQAFRMRDRIKGDRVEFAGSQTVDRIVKESKYDQEFPAASRYGCFWLPGYNEDMTEALVYFFDRSFGAHGYKVLLKKIEGKWSVVSFETDYTT